LVMVSSLVVVAVIHFVIGSLLSFLFQAEDGIRDRNVTGVQTCALPISAGAGPRRPACAGWCGRPRAGRRVRLPLRTAAGTAGSPRPWAGPPARSPAPGRGGRLRRGSG